MKPTAAAGSDPYSPPVSTLIAAQSDAASPYPPPMLTAHAQAEIVSATWAAKRATAASVGKATPVQATDMVTYTNPVLGLSFAYPAELGEVEFELWPGDTGFGWHLDSRASTPCPSTGAAVDFSQGRGADGRGLAWLCSRHGWHLPVAQILVSDS